MTSRMQAALRARRPLLLMAAIDHPDGMVYVHTGIGTISYNGQNWIGVGIFGEVGPVVISTETVIQEVTFTLSGVEDEDESLQFLNANVRNRLATVWLACLDEAGQVVRDPFQIMEAQMDYQTFDANEESGEVTIQIVARAGFYTLERAIDESWSPEDQKARYPADTGLDLVPGLADKDIIWTRT